MSEKPPSGGFLRREDISVSADFYIYTDHAEQFDRIDFERWCRSFGYEVELHPDFDLWQGGFAPIRFRADFLGAGSFLTGFELDCGENARMDMTAEPYEPPVKKQGFFAKLFGKKQPPVSIPPEYKTAPEPELPSPFEQAAGEKKWEICCCCHAGEPLAELMAYIFSAYFVEKFGAVTDDPQTGKWFTEPELVRAETENIRREMLASYRDWGLEFIPFTGWENVEE